MVWRNFKKATVLVAFLVNTTAINAASASEVAPVNQCKKGTKLFLENKVTEALPWLEAGFGSWNSSAIKDRNTMLMCSTVLGLIRNSIGQRTGALEAFAVKLEVSQSSGYRAFEGATQKNISEVYQAQGRYAEALKVSLEALAIQREVGEQLGEASVLGNIGEIYLAQGRLRTENAQLKLDEEILKKEAGYFVRESRLSTPAFCSRDVYPGARSCMLLGVARSG